MTIKLKRKLVLGATALAAAAFGGGAYAASRDPASGQRQAFINDVAKHLGVNSQQLEQALEAAFFDRLDAAVAAGKLTKAQADAIKRRVQQNGRIPFGPIGPFGRHGFGGPGGPRGLHHGLIDAAAKYLGLTDAQVRSQLQSSHSLADVAKSRGKSVGGLEQAMAAAVKAQLDKAVAAKRITISQEQRILNRVGQRITMIVNHKPPTGPRGRWGGPRGGGAWGAPPDGGPPEPGAFVAPPGDPGVGPPV
jgi:transposase-like protein